MFVVTTFMHMEVFSCQSVSYADGFSIESKFGLICSRCQAALLEMTALSFGESLFLYA